LAQKSSLTGVLLLAADVDHSGDTQPSVEDRNLLIQASLGRATIDQSVAPF
jgi:hypothetical protein